MKLVGALLPCVETSSWRGSADEEDHYYQLRMGGGASSPSGGGGSVPPFPVLASPTSAGPMHSESHASSVVVRERKRLKVSGFATLRKKLIRRRRSSKACDHGRVMRETVSDWTGVELASLVEEYEALAALKDLAVQAELARPPAPTFKQDLSALYDYKYCTDVDLVFRGACFPVHRAILSARCPYFRDLLAGCPGYGARICLELHTPGVDVEMFSALIRYLYTGDLTGGSGVVDLALLRRLGEEFGHPNPLEQDLRYLLETGDYADAVLVFTSDFSDYGSNASMLGDGAGVRRAESGCSSSGLSEYGFRPTKLELPCHKALLSARSPFFRNLIQRRSRSGEEHTERALHIPTRILLDESVIPKRYARVLLHAIYLDTVDLSLIIRGHGCSSSLGSLGEAEALAAGGSTGRSRPTALEEAMELYQIGRFLDLDIVSQGCEDIIVECLTIDSLPSVLRWSSEAHGSAWVLRQARHLLREEFSQVAHSPVLYRLEKEHLAEALRSDFLQASELEALQAVVKWGEHRLVRRMEDREPNLVSQTAHSVTRKGVKKRDLSDIELREILSELLPLVRMDHVIPPDAEALSQAIRRGLVSTPPTHMIGSDQVRGGGERINAWVRTSQHSGLFVRPRLFMPYYEEVKALVEEQLVSEGEMMRVRRARYIPDIPDTLYMVEEKPRPIDVIAQAIPVPDASTMAAMLKREQKLRQSPSCQRACSLALSSRHEVNRQIRLRVVREFGLPDCVAHILENAACYRVEEEEEGGDGMSSRGSSKSLSRSAGYGSVCRGSSHRRDIGTIGRHSTRHPLSSTPPSHHTLHHHGSAPAHLPAVVTEGSDLYHHHHRHPGYQCQVGRASSLGPTHKVQSKNRSAQWRGGGSGSIASGGGGLSGGEASGLSEVVPDVAMATAALGELSLSEGDMVSDEDESDGELGLDLGDGTTRHAPAYPPPPPPPLRFI